jgi:hypothetical protein
MTTQESIDQAETNQSEPVTLEQLTALLAGFKTEVLSEVNSANAGAVAATKKLLQKVTDTQAPAADSSAEANEDSGKLTLKALQTQLAELKAEREQERKETIEAKRNSALTQAIAGTGALNQKALYRLLLADHGENIQQENGTWFVKSGDETVVPLEAAVTKFLSSEEGKFFQAPSGVNGAGSSETKAATSNPPVTYSSRLEQMTAELASGEAKLAL